MKRYFLVSTIFLFVVAAILLTGAGIATAQSCQDNCKSYCCTDSKCTKEKQAECYSDCLRTCNNPQPQPAQPTKQAPPS